MRGQTNLSVISRIEALAPGWDKLCMEENSVFRIDSGTKGRNRPVLVSHTTSNSVFGTGIFENVKDVLFSRSRCCSC